MRICILCEESKLEQVREKIGNKNILSISCSENGELPASHRFCTMAMPEKKANQMVSSAQLTIIEIMEPKEFLEKWNLKIIR